MPANYEDDDQPYDRGRERLGDRRFQPCAWLPQARSYLRNADPVLARLSNDGMWGVITEHEWYIIRRLSQE